MRLRSRLKEWVAYRRDVRRSRREYRNVRRDYVDSAEGERFRSQHHGGGASGGGPLGGGDGGGM